MQSPGYNVQEDSGGIMKDKRLSKIYTWCNTIHKLTNQERDNAICFLSYVIERSSLHQLTSTVSNYNDRPLSRCDTQLNNLHTLHMNSSKDH